MKHILVASFLVLAVACTPQQKAQTAGGVNTASQTLINACATAMTLAPRVPSLEPWIVGGCGTVDAIARLAADPTSEAWVNGLIITATNVIKANVPPLP